MASHLLNLLLLLSTSGCLCQKDCTGVDCPVLDKCIEEVLETGACCATCMKTGCMCEGYQYYDCTSAGFRNGKVPEGESYFVDFGSTECSCPQGGGRISCHFMPCPEIPANCIELTEPADGCIHCERFGCVHGEEKYEAGHSVQTDPCQVCHCPGGGGELMCYPIPNCDPNLIPKPVHVPAGADGTSEGLYKDHLLHVHQGSRGPISKLLPAAHKNNGPLNLHPSHIVDEEEDEEDYDYPPTDYLDPSLHGFASPTKSSIISGSNQQNFTPRPAFHRGTKQELREVLGIHKSTTDRPQFPSHKTSTDRMKISTHKDKAKEENFLKYKTDQEQFILPVETTNRVGISSQKETPQSFSLYKEHSNQEDLTDVDSNTNNEHLEFPKETSEGDIYNLEDDTTTTESSTTLEQTFSQLLETTASWQTAWNGVSESQIYSVLPDTMDADISKREESITAALNQTTIHDGTQPAVVEGNENILNSLDPVQQSVTASGVDSGQTLPEHGKSPFEAEKPSGEHKQLSATHIVDHEKLIENHKHPTEELVRSSGDHKTKSERKQKWQLFSPEEFTPTSLSPNTQSHSLFNLREEQEEADNTLSSHSSMKEGSIESCCAAGQKWEEENQHCNFMPVISEDLSSVCSVVQKQCCSGALRESRCQAGINVAKAGQACEEGNSSPCGEDSQKDCCSCCALGLRLRREGRDCKAHRYLSYPCGHVFLACCEDGEEGLSPPTLKKKEKPEPTATPKRVSDGPFPKQALSAGEVDPAANSLEDLEHEDRCQRFGAICHHACINTHESYLCVCHPGYRLLQDARTCVPENQEEDNRVSEEDQVVTVSPAQQETSTETPVLYNPCAGNGPCAQRCSPIRGLAHCSCFHGYFLMVDGHTCEDLNECVTNTHTCQSDERCVNTIGSFMCQRRISCSRGYQERNGVCEDIDECVVRTHNCGTGFECQNTDGSFTCNPKQRCLTGFTQDIHGNCLDIDECSSISEPCTSGFNCINTVGSYTCQRKIIICSRGYHSSPDGARCVDVDECQTSTHRCGQGQICHNLPGSYRCDCQTGYQYDSIRKLCVDVNECWRYPGRLCAQTCENTPGSYQCSCTTGFSLAFDGKNCEDLNECDGNPCGQECANIYGSYQCYCRMGYYLKEDGHTCEDIDECSQSIGNLCAFQCENVPGSYKCACPPHGYTMSPNGRTCEDIDECAIGSHNCSASQTCFNLQGGFRCLSFTCPENYKKVSDTRCERLNCPNFQQCQTMPSRITYYQMSFQTNIVIPAQIFRIGPSPAYSGDNIIISIPRGNEEGYFSTRKLNSFTGAVYLHRQMHEPRDFLIDVEMKLLRQGTFTTFLARIYVFITPNSM